MTFVIDGFNLYHSIRDVERETGVNCRWLDIRSLCSTLVSSSLGPDGTRTPQLALGERPATAKEGVPPHCD